MLSKVCLWLTVLSWIKCGCTVVFLFCLSVGSGHAPSCPGEIKVYVLLQKTLPHVLFSPSLNVSPLCRWQEALTVYPRTNKQNQKKKRKVDPPTHQVTTPFTHPPSWSVWLRSHWTWSMKPVSVCWLSFDSTNQPLHVTWRQSLYDVPRCMELHVDHNEVNSMGFKRNNCNSC